MIRGPDFEWISQLCRLHRPPRPAIVPVDWYPPSGNPDGEHLDAILETEDHLKRIAVEVTRCFRGDRVFGEAKLEEQLLHRFCAWLRDAAVSCLGDRGYRITYTVYLPAPLSTLVPRLKDFLGSLQEQFPTRTAIEHALRDAEQRRHAVMIGNTDVNVLPVSALFHPGSQVYVQDIVAADPTEVAWKFEEPAPGGRGDQWQTTIPMNFWTNTQAIIDAIADKRAKLPRYRGLAIASNAQALWLLLVVEQSSGWDILASLYGDNKGSLNTALAEQPQFDEIYLLAQMPGYPWNLRRLWPVTPQPRGA